MADEPLGTCALVSTNRVAAFGRVFAYPRIQRALINVHTGFEIHVQSESPGTGAEVPPWHVQTVVFAAMNPFFTFVDIITRHAVLVQLITLLACAAVSLRSVDTPVMADTFVQSAVVNLDTAPPPVSPGSLAWGACGTFGSTAFAPVDAGKVVWRTLSPARFARSLVGLESVTSLTRAII